MKYLLFLMFLSCNFVDRVLAQTVIYDEHAEVRQVDDFSGVEVSGTIVLYISQGPNAVAISAGEEKNNAKIKTEVVNGILKIWVDGGMWNAMGLADRKLKAYVSVNEINRLNVSGSSYATINGVLRANALQVNINGASELKGNIEVQALNLSMGGASVARLGGKAKQGTINANGASRISAYNLTFDNLNASITHAASLKVTVDGELIADASSGSTLSYKGNATAVQTNARDGAAIKKMENDKD